MGGNKISGNIQSPGSTMETKANRVLKTPVCEVNVPCSVLLTPEKEKIVLHKYV
jgi:hypothetical protein